MLFGSKRILAAVLAVTVNVLLACGASYAISGTVDITGQKVVNGASEISEGEFSFELRKPGSDTVIMTTTNDADGNIVFKDVPYSDADILNEKYIIYEVTEVPGDDDTIIYDSNVGYAVLQFEEGGSPDAEEITITYAKPVSMEIRYDGLEYNVFHATDEDLQGVAYSVFDSRDGSLTFFRDEDGAYEDRKYVYNDGWYLYYTVVQETGDSGFNYNNGSTPYYNESSKVKSVRFKDAVRPEYIGFSEFENCESYDLRKLDTSRLTTMNDMFKYNRNQDTFKSINISNFDTSNVTKMDGMFEGDVNLQRVIWGDPDTTKVTDMTDMMRRTRLEYFDFSKFETNSLEYADYMFGTSSQVPVAMRRIDMSNWKRNGEYVDGRVQKVYGTSNMFYRYDGDFLDITNLGAVYSAEFSTLYGVKVVKLCIEHGASYASPLIAHRPMINVMTGEVTQSQYGYITEDLCGTYATMSDTEMTFVNQKKAQLEVKKVNEDGEALAGAEMALKMDGSVIYSWETGDDAVFFSNLAFGHDYEIIEYEAPEGYRVASPVSFNVSADGVVTSNGEEVSSIEIEDELNAVRVKKVWDDEGKEQYRPESVTFELLDADANETIDEITVTADDANADGAWVGEFKDYSEYGLDDRNHNLVVIEKDDFVNYSPVYQLDGREGGSVDPIAGDRITVKNEFNGSLIDYEFTKEWLDEGYESQRPEFIEVSIFESGDMEKAIASIQVVDDGDGDNAWHGKFEGLLEKDNAGETIRYIIVETAIDGYETSYAADGVGEEDAPFVGATIITNAVIPEEEESEISPEETESPDTRDKIVICAITFAVSLGGAFAFSATKKR